MVGVPPPGGGDFAPGGPVDRADVPVVPFFGSPLHFESCERGGADLPWAPAPAPRPRVPVVYRPALFPGLFAARLVVGWSESLSLVSKFSLRVKVLIVDSVIVDSEIAFSQSASYMASLCLSASWATHI